MNLLEELKAILDRYLPRERGIVETDTWDGSAANYPDTDAYCQACLIDVNAAAGRDPKVQSHCLLPVRRPGDARSVYVRPAVFAAAGGHGITQVQRPDDVPAKQWQAAKKAAANDLIAAYGQMDATAPASVYQLAEQPLPEAARAISVMEIRDQVPGLLAARSDFSPYALLLDVVFQDTGLFAVIADKGKLWFIPVTMTATGIVLDTPTEIVPPPQTRGQITIQRTAAGRARFWAIAATSVLNRAAEIDSRALLQSLTTGELPFVTFWHLGEAARMGTVTGRWADGDVLIETGELDNTPAGNAMARAIEAHPQYYGVSVAYFPATAPEYATVHGVQIPVYTRGVQRELSILPEAKAASWFTMVGGGTLKSEIFDELVRALGPEEATRIATAVDGTQRAITEGQLVTRAEAPMPPDTAGSKALDTTAVELTDAVLSKIVAAVLATEAVQTLDARIGALETALAQYSALEERVCGVEKHTQLREEELKREWLANTPGPRRVTLTAPAAPPVQETLSVDAILRAKGLTH
jgi:hypothetical protein